MVHLVTVKEIVSYIEENIGRRKKCIDLEDPTDLMFERVCEYLKR